MKGKAIIPLVLGLGVGLVAVKFLVDTLQKARGANANRQNIQVVRTRQDIDSYQELTPDLLEIVQTVESDLVPVRDRVSDLDSVVGRVTAKSIPQHTPLLISMLAPAGTSPGMVGMIPQGYRAVSVKIDEVTGVAYQLKPGDWVDVIVVMDVDSNSRLGRKETIAEVILENIKVLAVGQGTSTSQPPNNSKVTPAKSATLRVANEDVPKLHLAATRGKITLSMRGVDDPTTNMPRIARGSEVIEGLRDPLAVEQPTPAGLSIVEQMMQKLASAGPTKEVKVEPKAQVPSDWVQPYSVTVFRAAPTGDLKAERITFQNVQSRKIIGVADGAISESERILASRADDKH